MRILIVDDEPNIRRTLRATFEVGGHAVEEAGSVPAAVAAAGKGGFDVALVDVRLGTESGLDLIEPLLAHLPRLAIVIITAHATIDLAVEAMRRGAFDFLPKPFTPAQVRAILERVGRLRGLKDRVADLEDQVRAEIPEAELDSPDPATRRAFELARRAAQAEAAVLVRGESGTGKGVLARALHAWSKRAQGPFVTVSCPSLSAELLESELFGHVRGAFTSAVRDAAGKVSVAEGGTLFLDEVGDLPTPLQPKLLRFLQERKYERVGDTATRAADVRIVAATNRDLEAAVAAGTFREDLFYRLNVVEIHLPPLRARTDLPDLADRLLAFFARQTGRRLTRFTDEARAAMTRHPWPGNLRELRNTIERGAILAEGPEVGLADLPDRIASPRAGAGPSAAGDRVEVGAQVSLDRLEEAHIRRILGSTNSREEAAHILGIDPSTLYRKRKQFGL
ncbi:Alginate biosynthesis transcriptional regulatory protein AlgB [Aquisphaera giovannonii]|uniref:Alginate biosynthesis transcriptional regulatory protein AlgB n=1 Tax=Aquisphaera giovannonii TaxID=406548 RepID=A0A5B9WG90_9BACT|nr:sigma-54 dependent transcriptional regulator [Aquisphaera giovannonii]QEH38860.1 Alginate biosynthesis transcriptional regulatory protein AlgB [Aquisphaera giovannonii]